MPQSGSDDALNAALAADRAQALALFGEIVSRETWARLDQFVALLIRRQKTLNLVAASTLPQIWTRHVADSLQLLALAPTARKWIDLGAGGGFPGLVIACALAEPPGAQVHLVESTQKKAAFLRDVALALSLPAIVHARRIEDFVASNRQMPNPRQRCGERGNRVVGANPLIGVGAQAPLAPARQLTP